MATSQEIQARVYILLYRSGLKKQEISLNLLEISNVEIVPSTRDSWQVFDELFSDVIDWMKREGLIYYESRTHEAKSKATLFEGVQLSQKGVNMIEAVNMNVILRKDPEILNEKIKEGSKIYSNIGDLLGSMLGSFVKSASG